jgi:hypothetical protein
MSGTPSFLSIKTELINFLLVQKMKYISLFLVLSFVFLQGCASGYRSDYKSNSSHSEAWNISKASNIRINEIPEKKMREALGDSYDNEETGVLVQSAIDSGVVSAALLSTNGFLMLSEIGTSFGLSLLLNATRPDDPEFTDHILAWMPSNLAKNVEDAAKQMIRISVEAFKQIPEDHPWKIDWVKTYENLEKVDTSFLNSRYDFQLYFEGGECDVFDCMLFIYVYEPNLTLKPDFINADVEQYYHFYPYGNYFPMASVFCNYPKPEMDILMKFKSGKPKVKETSYDFKACQDRGKKLYEQWLSWMPNWFFAYRSPSRTNLPYLTNQDKILLYIKPEQNL